jgi:hypothetical protein
MLVTKKAAKGLSLPYLSMNYGLYLKWRFCKKIDYLMVATKTTSEAADKKNLEFTAYFALFSFLWGFLSSESVKILRSVM